MENFDSDFSDMNIIDDDDDIEIFQRLLETKPNSGGSVKGKVTLLD